MEEDVFTPPRGGRLAPQPQGVQKEARAVPKIFMEMVVKVRRMSDRYASEHGVTHAERLGHTPG